MAIAYFDFDGTLIRRESGVICAIPSLRSGLIAPRHGARLIGTYLLSKTGLRSRTDAQRVGFECYRGKTLEELRVIMQGLYDRHVRSFVSAPVRAKVEEHRREGHRLVVLTASAFFFAEPIARDLGFDEVIGTNMAFEDGLCTGVVEGDILDGFAKLRAAKDHARARAVDLARCTFYSDHPADLPLLEAVGTPVAVGPTRALHKVARARGWTIVHHDT